MHVTGPAGVLLAGCNQSPGHPQRTAATRSVNVALPSSAKPPVSKRAPQAALYAVVAVDRRGRP